MSVGTDSNNLWHGIPLAQVRTGFFVDKFRTVYTLRKLIINNRENVFSTAEDGAVTMDGSYLNWTFICPLNTFTVADFSGKTVGGFYDEIISYTAENQVKAWEDFAAFVAPHRVQINQLIGTVISAEITAPSMTGSVAFSSIPTFPEINDFSSLVAWIKSILPSSMLSHSASEMQADAGDGKYSFGVILLMTVEDGNTQQTAAMSFSFVI